MEEKVEVEKEVEMGKMGFFLVNKKEERKACLERAERTY